MIPALISEWRVLGFLVLLALFFVALGFTAGQQWPGPEWQRNPAAACREYLNRCPTFHFCSMCGQHKDWSAR